MAVKIQYSTYKKATYYKNTNKPNEVFAVVSSYLSFGFNDDLFIGIDKVISINEKGENEKYNLRFKDLSLIQFIKLIIIIIFIFTSLILLPFIWNQSFIYLFIILFMFFISYLIFPKELIYNIKKLNKTNRPISVMWEGLSMFLHIIVFLAFIAYIIFAIAGLVKIFKLGDYSTGIICILISLALSTFLHIPCKHIEKYFLETLTKNNGWEKVEDINT